MSRKTLGIFLLVAAFAVVGFVAYKNSTKRQVPVVFSPRDELQSLWIEYKKNYIEPSSNRVIDPENGSITTSEGESYAMLRAVWLDDKDSFDKSWNWTKQNLQRQDHVFSWLYGKRPDGTYGILTNQNGENSAADADTDIAVALVFASGRWNEASYLADARNIIGGIWQNEVVTVNGKPYIVANNLEKNSPATMVINPSYLSPYAYRVFASVDPNHPWSELVDTSYDVLNQSVTSPLDKTASAHIPPDWIFIDKRTGAILPSTRTALSSNTSFDALRVPWRVYLDWLWYKEPRAKTLLEKMTFFSTEWKDRSLLYTNYEHNGTPALQSQTAAFYGGTLGYFLVTDPEAARSIYETKLQVLFSPDSNTWDTKLGYYDENWAWFGIALYNTMLPNLAAINQTS